MVKVATCSLSRMYTSAPINLVCHMGQMVTISGNLAPSTKVISIKAANRAKANGKRAKNSLIVTSIPEIILKT